MQKEIMLRAMRFDDLDKVYEIERCLFPNPWPRYFFEEDLQSSNTIAFVVENDGEIIGYSLGSCADIRLHITNIAVVAGCQRRGIGQILLREMESVAIERGCTFAYLEVRMNNTAALGMYKNAGYGILHVSKRYYIDGDDAYVMHKELI
jgi:ribosomal-protein-alanine N-acetyltransferase